MNIRLMLFAGILASCVVTPSAAVPIELTPYGKAGFRLEARPQPMAVTEDISREARERMLAQSGVQARWIQVVDNYGAPLIKNPYLPCTDPNADQNEIILKKWVSEIKKSGMAAMSWYPLSFCHSAWEQTPQWRQIFQIPYNEPGFACCFETGYGDALINYCNYAIERLGLDGIWFDGAAWTPIWSRPLPLSCSCESCKAKFRADTSFEIPTKIDWDDAVFRTWVRWRFKEFGGYIGKLAGAIRREHPNTAVAINHYHRPGTPWQSAIPIDLYRADIISGSEATDPDSVDLTIRLCRAYGRSQAEMWREFVTGEAPEVNAEPLIRHAMICYAAGGHPSYGGDLLAQQLMPTAALVSPIVNAINEYASSKSLPYAAIHVSQQTETFYCERGGLDFFASLSQWTQALGNKQVPPDYIYDSSFTSAKLANYKLLFMPVSLALSDAQSKIVLNYVKSGGTAVLGIAAGQLDKEAMPKKINMLSEALGFAFDRAPNTDGSDAGAFTVTMKATNKTHFATGVRVPMHITSSGWTTLATVANEPVAATRRYGKGRVIVVAVDPANTIGSTPAAAGDTSIEVTSETAATGKRSLKFVDDAIAPMPWYPDLENKIEPFGIPEYSGGNLDFDMRVDVHAEATIELRSRTKASPGPMVVLGGGKVRNICDLPIDQWVHINIAYNFASGTKTSMATITVTLPDGTKHSVDTGSGNPSYQQTDWLVIYGSGTKHSTFYLDNLKLTALRPDGTQKSIIDLDFENGSGLLEPPTRFLGSLIDLAKQSAPSKLKVIAPDYVRTGIFKGKSKQILVHLHNTKGIKADWQRATGPTVLLDCGFAVRSAKLAISGKPLSIRKLHGRWQIKVPQMGSYQVVEIRQ